MNTHVISYHKMVEYAAANNYHDGDDNDDQDSDDGAEK